MTTLSRRAGYRLGLRAETIAALYLRLKFYRILARRFASPAGEIDLVARRGTSLVFVEVKARPTLEAAAESIRHMQRARIVQAANAFLSRHPHYINHFARFDAILIAPGRWPRHLISAFDANGMS
jgi:putative endonuclease